MDERFRGKGRLWIGLGFLTIVFLCVTLCAFGALFTMAARPGPTYVQPLPGGGEEGGAPAPPAYDYGPMGYGRHGWHSPLGIVGFGIGLLFKLLFFGLLTLLALGLVKRLFWGRPHYWGRHYCAPHPGKPSGADPGWRGRARHPHWGPWAWHPHWGPQGPEEETADEGMEEDEAAYTGPQE